MSKNVFMVTCENITKEQQDAILADMPDANKVIKKMDVTPDYATQDSGPTLEARTTARIKNVFKEGMIKGNPYITSLVATPSVREVKFLNDKIMIITMNPELMDMVELAKKSRLPQLLHTLRIMKFDFKDLKKSFQYLYGDYGIKVLKVEMV